MTSLLRDERLDPSPRLVVPGTLNARRPGPWVQDSGVVIHFFDLLNTNEARVEEASGLVRRP